MNELRAKNLNVGDIIRHTAFGKGLVTKYEPSSNDAIITIDFNDNNGAKRFLLNHTPMKIIEKYTAPPKKIKEVPHPDILMGEKANIPLEKIKDYKSPRTYTTEFKIEVVKQALSEGRAVVRKQYKLPETTLRNWIKQFNTEGE